MKISVSTLIDDVGGEFTELRREDTASYIYDVRPFEEGKRQDPDILYLIDVKTMPENFSSLPRNFFLLQRGTVELVAEPDLPMRTVNAYVIRSRDTSDTVFTSIYEHFYRCSRDYSRVLEEVLGTYNAQKVVDAVSSVMDAPVMLLDNSLKIIAANSNGYNDPVWKRQISTGFLDNNDMIGQSGVSLLSVASGKSAPVYFEGPEGGSPSIVSNIFVGGSNAGMLQVLLAERSPTIGFMEKVGAYSELMGMFLQRDPSLRGNSGASIAQLIEDFLNGSLTDPGQARARARNLGYEYSGSFFLIIMRSRNDVMSQEQLGRIRNRFFLGCEVAKGTIHDDAIVILIKGDDAVEVTNQYPALGRFLDRYQMQAATSFSSAELVDIPTLYRQALNMLQYGQMHGLEDAVLHFSQNQLHVFYYMCSKMGGVDDFMSAELLRLLDKDRTGENEYVKTLEVYLNTGMNKTDTGELLQLHRSSLRYRLEKIEEIIGRPIESGDFPQHASMTIRILREKGELD